MSPDEAGEQFSRLLFFRVLTMAIQLKRQADIEGLRAAGHIVAEAFARFRESKFQAMN